MWETSRIAAYAIFRLVTRDGLKYRGIVHSYPRYVEGSVEVDAHSPPPLFHWRGKIIRKYIGHRGNWYEGYGPRLFDSKNKASEKST